MKRLGIVFGGKSGEHEVSLMSATSVIGAIDREKYETVLIGIDKDGKWYSYEGDIDNIANGEWIKTAVPYSIGKLKEDVDFVFPVLHGPYGEDGTIQGLLEMADIPYAGCGVLASALAMDKGLAKDVFKKCGLPICGHVVVCREEVEINLDLVVEKIEGEMEYNVFVKPANMGSSVGISKVRNREELKKALVEACKYDRRLVIEEGINCRELETGVIGNYFAEAAEVGEIIPKEDFYDYKAKYTDEAGTVLQIPAEISKDMREEIRRIAVEAYKALDCAGFSRVDFFVDKDTNKVYINEINTIPGFTKYSMFPSLWKEAGIGYSELIEKIVEYGYERYYAKSGR